MLVAECSIRCTRVSYRRPGSECRSRSKMQHTSYCEMCSLDERLSIAAARCSSGVCLEFQPWDCDIRRQPTARPHRAARTGNNLRAKSAIPIATIGTARVELTTVLLKILETRPSHTTIGSNGATAAISVLLNTFNRIRSRGAPSQRERNVSRIKNVQNSGRAHSCKMPELLQFRHRCAERHTRVRFRRGRGDNHAEQMTMERCSGVFRGVPGVPGRIRGVPLRVAPQSVSVEWSGLTMAVIECALLGRDSAH
jgi:hypothetical protein